MKVAWFNPSLARVFVSCIMLMLSSESLHSQEINKGRYCLTYFPQPVVESYIDSLADYLEVGFADENGMLDSITLQYIDHFTKVPIRKSKCVFFHQDTVMIREKVGEDVSSAYLVIPEANELLTKKEGELIRAPYKIDEEESSGHFDFFVREIKDDTKVIEGFPCYRVEIKEVYYPGGESDSREKDYVLYVTDRIKVPGSVILGNNMQEDISCPLEVTEPLNNEVMITYRAQGMRFSLEAGTFTL